MILARGRTSESALDGNPEGKDGQMSDFTPSTGMCWALCARSCPWSKTVSSGVSLLQEKSKLQEE